MNISHARYAKYNHVKQIDPLKDLLIYLVQKINFTLQRLVA